MPSSPIDWASIPTPDVQWPSSPSDDHTREPYLETGREGITITPHRSSEADVRAIVVMSNIPSIAKWSFRREYPYERVNALQWLLHQLPPAVRAATQLENGLPLSPPHCPFNVIRRDGALIGDCDLFNVHGEWRLGYTMHPDHHNKGICTAAVTRLIAWGREHLGLTQLTAHAEEANGPSQAVLTKLGFRKEGVESQEWPEHHGGGHRDVGVWRLDLGA